MYGKTTWPGVSDVTQRHVAKIGRNDACPCGSGKKYKSCHEKDGTAYLEKLAREGDMQQRREVRERLRLEGVPWYKRLFVR
jgi:hypothetical protein